MKILFRIIVLSLAVLSGSVTAQDAQGDSEARGVIEEVMNREISIHDENTKDYAHVWFAKIFGEFIYKPWESGGESFDENDITIIAKSVGFTNILAIILGVVIVYYVMIGGAVNTAQHGEPLGKQWSSTWIPIRTAMGFFLVMPIPTVGAGVMSFAQMFIIWLILLGSNAASFLWSKTVDNIMEPVVGQSQQVSFGAGPVMDVAKMMACTEHVLRNRSVGMLERIRGAPENLKYAEVTFYDPGYLGLDNYSSQNLYTSHNERYGFRLPADMDELAGVLRSKPVTQVKFAAGSCGSLSFKGPLEINNKPGQKAMDYRAQIQNNAIVKARHAYADALEELAPLMAILTDPEKAGGIRINALIREKQMEDVALVQYERVVDRFFKIVRDFDSNLNREISEVIDNDGKTIENFKASMKHGGWGKAGVWFFEIGSINALPFHIASSIRDIAKFSGVNFCTLNSGKSADQCETQQSSYSADIAMVNEIVKGVVERDHRSAGERITNEVDQIVSKQTGDEQAPDTAALKTLSVSLAQTVIDLMAEGDPTKDNNGLHSPFITVQSIGHTLNNGALVLYGASMIVYIIADSYDSSIVGVGAKLFGLKGIALVAKWLVYTTIALVGIMASSGFVLAYVIPFLPIVTWVMMVTGHLITVVEAVIAAPLAIILMVTPEGEGIAGQRLERALKLLFVAILKPSLMIIGLIASVHIAGVAFAIMNEFFFIAANGNLGSGTLPYNFAAILLIYVSTALKLSQYLISIMYKLPEQILDWMSSGSGRSFGENEIGSTITEASAGMKQSAGSVQGLLARQIAQARENRKDKKQA